MCHGFYHPSRGYWQAIDVDPIPYEVIIEPERTEAGPDGEEITIPAVTRTETHLERLMASYPEGTIEVPLKPGADYDWQGGAWVYVVPEPISREEWRQTADLAKPDFLLRSKRAGYLTGEEAIAAAKGDLPPRFAPALAENPAIDMSDVAILWAASSRIERLHIAVEAIALAEEILPEDVDDLFGWPA